MKFHDHTGFFHPHRYVVEVYADGKLHFVMPFFTRWRARHEAQQVNKSVGLGVSIGETVRLPLRTGKPTASIRKV